MSCAELTKTPFFLRSLRGHKPANERTSEGGSVEEHFEDPGQPRKDPGPDPLAGEGSGEEEPEHVSEREAEEDVLEEES
jgi:hypothetical protein